MLREGALSQPRIITLLSKCFVPVAVNLYELRETNTPAAKVYRKIHKQKPQYQGFWIVTPAGKVLAGHQDYKSEETWPAEVYATLKKGLKAFGKVTPRKVSAHNPWPYRGKGIRPDGSARFAIYIRNINNGRLGGPGIIDSLTLSAKEFRELSPRAFQKGASWIVPDKVSRKLCKCLSPDSDLVTLPLPKEVKKVNLVGTVFDVKGNVAILTYQGNISAVHRHLYEKNKTNRCTARIQGAAEYDMKSRKMQALVFVLDGIFHNFQPFDREAQPIIAGVEWQLSR